MKFIILKLKYSKDKLFPLFDGFPLQVVCLCIDHDDKSLWDYYFSYFTMILNCIFVGLPWIVDARDIHCLFFQCSEKSFPWKKTRSPFSSWCFAKFSRSWSRSLQIVLQLKVSFAVKSPAALQYKKVTKINMVDVLYNTSLSKRCNQPKFSIVTNKISRWNEADFIHFHSASFEPNKGKKKYF